MLCAGELVAKMRAGSTDEIQQHKQVLEEKKGTGGEVELMRNTYKSITKDASEPHTLTSMLHANSFTHTPKRCASHKGMISTEIRLIPGSLGIRRGKV